MNPEPLEQPVQFGGRYLLTRLLAVGGMAEIYLARQPAPHGFDKDVVIKRLKPDLVGDSRVVDMFLDEARIGGVLNHPNVVHVYDIGDEGDVPFIAMEYIHGEELNQLCRRGLSLGEFLPLEHAVELIRQAACAMGYFHAARDSSGHSLDIVHCDISPTNLLVTNDGFLKVIDFGIARARDQRHADEHAVPGKLSYMSPEQARRKRLDHRSDIFSLGVVLYEITLGRRLFKGPAQEVYERLGKCDIEPPTFVRNDYPGALESIVMRALEKDPHERFETGYDLADALAEYLRDANVASGPIRIARYLDRLAVAAGGARREELISEAESRGDDEGLDFDRGLFDGYRAAVEPSPEAAAEWEEFDEDEQAVADAIGIDVSLVRTAARLATAEESGSLARMLTPTPTPPPVSELAPAPEPSVVEQSANAPKSQPSAAGPGVVVFLALLLAGGAAGALITYLALR